MRELAEELRALRGEDRRALAILVYAPFALALLEFFFVPYRTPVVFEWARAAAAKAGSFDDLLTFVWWIAGVVLLCVIGPSILLKATCGVGPRELGLKLKGTSHGALTYAALYAIVLPVLVIVSRRDDFRASYPFFRATGEHVALKMALFEAAYFFQFLGVEYFFRGVMVIGLKPRFGRTSVLVMLAPYCMIHFHKPFAEALGAVVSGVVLGALAWRTETVVYGWFLHFAIALTLDMLAFMT